MEKKNAALLTLLMLVKKLLSIVYKIPYQNVTGDAGFYVFQQIYPFIAISMLLTGYALPTVIGSLLAEQHYSMAIKDKLKRSMWMLSVLTFAILTLANRQIALIMGDVLLAPIIRVVGIHFLFISPIAYMRGVLQSRPETIKGLGYSIVIEQITRVFAVLMVLYLFDVHTIGYYQIAEFAFMFSLISPVVTTIHLYLLKPEDDIQSFLPLTERSQFFRRSLYLLCSAGILVIFGLIDNFLVFNTLITTQSQDDAMVLKGIFERGLPLVQAGTFFVSTLVSLTMSKFETAVNDKQKKIAFSTGLFYILGFAIPSTVGLVMVTPYLNMTLFMDQAGNRTLQIMMVQIVLYALVVLLTATLSRAKRQSFVLASLLIGILIKLLLTAPLVSQYGISGAAISSVVALTIMSIMMLFCVKSLFTTKLVAIFIGISISTVAMWLGLRQSAPFIAFLNDDTRYGYLYLVVANTGIGIAVYGLVMALQIYLFSAVGKRILIQHQKRRERVIRAARAHERRREEALRLQEEQLQVALRFQREQRERERYRQSLMQNKPKQGLTVEGRKHLDEHGHRQNPMSEPLVINQLEIQQEREVNHERKEGKKMRLDKFLKVSRIIKRRQTAKEVSDAGKISVNGKVAKSSTSLSVGDEIALHYATRTLVVKVMEIKDSTKKEDAERMYEIVREEPRN
jgi:PST family polysaccharide transporter